MEEHIKQAHTLEIPTIPVSWYLAVVTFVIVFILLFVFGLFHEPVSEDGRTKFNVWKTIFSSVVCAVAVPLLTSILTQNKQ